MNSSMIHRRVRCIYTPREIQDLFFSENGCINYDNSEKKYKNKISLTYLFAARTWEDNESPSFILNNVLFNKACISSNID